MAVAVTLVKKLYNQDKTLKQFVVDASLVLTGNYGGGATHGDTMDVSKLGIPSGYVPTQVEFFEYPAAPAVPSGYASLMTYTKGTNQTNGLLNIVTAPGTEYTQGSAYNAGLLAAVLFARVWFEKFA